MAIRVESRTKESIILCRLFMFLRQFFRLFPLIVAKWPTITSVGASYKGIVIVNGKKYLKR